MANTQTSVPLFVANTVLTAAAQNISAGTGVPVFATTVTRDAAFGGSNKALAEGQLCYLESTDVVQYYTGAAWATVGPSTGGLAFISGTTFSAASTVSLPTSTFSATYSNYLLKVEITSASGTDVVLNSRMRVAGADSTAASYSSTAGSFYANFGGTTATSQFSSAGTSFVNNRLDATTTGASLNIDFVSPFATQKTLFTSASIGKSLTDANLQLVLGGGVFNATTSFDSFSFFPASGTITGSYKVYGYANS